MSTSPEDNDPTDRTQGTDRTPDADDAPGAESRVPFTSEEYRGAGVDAGAATPQEEGFAKPSGPLSAETFALTALALLAVTALSSQLLQLFTTAILVGDQPVPMDQVTQLSTQIIIGGTAAAVTALTAGLALALSDTGSRPWARWAATAALIVSLLLLILAVVAYALLPAGTELQPPVIPQ